MFIKNIEKKLLFEKILEIFFFSLSFSSSFFVINWEFDQFQIKSAKKKTIARFLNPIQ
jgi:hypothetical protein